MTYALGKDFFAAATFKDLWDSLSGRVTKFITYFGLTSRL